MAPAVDLWPAETAREAEEDVFESFLSPKRKGEKAPADWREWLTTLFPAYFDSELAQRHLDFWKWVLAIKLGEPSHPLIAIWPRGGGKSTSAEGAAVAVGVRGRRRYCLYVRETQEMADKSVGNIAAMLESAAIERFYPEHARPAIGKFGHSKGWRRERLRTAGGYTIDALGLDTAARGLKVEDQRPDFMVFDDIDGKHDTLATTKRKEETITHSILPAMDTTSGTVLGIQNLIIPNGLFTQLADGRAEFLSDRHISGPFVAVAGLQWEWRQNPKTGLRTPVITGGKATWSGQSLVDCQHLMTSIGPTAFMKECQHRVKGKVAGVALKYDDAQHGVDLSDEKAADLCAMGRVFGGIDFGAWRFGFVLFAVDRHGIPHRIDEVFSQNESLTARARKIHETCERYGVTRMIIWGDAANPQDIMEINLAFRRGWDIEAEDRAGNPIIERVSSALRVVKVGNENKLRKAGLTRINDALDRNAIRFRRGVAATEKWFLAMAADSEGTEQVGSRLMWEIDNWAFPVPKPGELQEQDPIDESADGADMIAAMRYALMSWWSKAKVPKDYPIIPDDRSKPFDYKGRRFREHPHALDEITGEGAMAGRRSPRPFVPRPRSSR